MLGNAICLGCDGDVFLVRGFTFIRARQQQTPAGRSEETSEILGMQELFPSLNHSQRLSYRADSPLGRSHGEAFERKGNKHKGLAVKCEDLCLTSDKGAWRPEQTICTHKA